MILQEEPLNQDFSDKSTKVKKQPGTNAHDEADENEIALSLKSVVVSPDIGCEDQEVDEATRDESEEEEEEVDMLDSSVKVVLESGEQELYEMAVQFLSRFVTFCV